MHASVLTWVKSIAGELDVADKPVIEVGAYDVNGSVRPIVAALGPASYLGIDIAAGPGVDEVCDAVEALERFGTFGLVISTEMLEHVVDWKAAVLALVDLVAPGGQLLITTRSVGFPYHPYPIDTWRYSLDAGRAIMEALGMDVIHVNSDPEAPGIFVLAGKPLDWTPNPFRFDQLADVTGVTAMVQS